MKSLILIAVLLFASTAFSQYTDLTEDDLSKNSEFFRDLQYLCPGFIAQKGIYESTKAPLPGSWYNITEVEKQEKRVTSTITYYRFTLLLTEQENRAVVRATVVISYYPATGNFIFSSYKYNILKQSAPNGGFFMYEAVDLRAINDGSSELADVIDENFDYIMNEAFQKTDYTFVKATKAYRFGSVENHDLYRILIKVKGSDGKYHRVEFSYDKNLEDGTTSVDRVSSQNNAY